jgi:hypothetical protein
MTTLGGAIADIRGDLNRDTTFDSRIQQALISAIKFYRARRYGFNVKRKTFQLAGEFTSLTANFIEIDYAKLQIGTRYKPLPERNYNWLNERMRFQSLSSEPTWFAIQDRNLRVYPPPDQSYSCEIHYLFELTDISLSTSDSTTSNAWFNEGYELIRLHATIEMLELYIDGPDALTKADRLRLREAEAEKELKRRANREQSSGTIRGHL